MGQMAYSLKSVEPYQIGFKQAALYLAAQLSILPAVAPGRVPQVMNEILAMVRSFVLPARRQRHYPRAVKKKPQRYPLRRPQKSLTDKHYGQLTGVSHPMLFTQRIQ